MKIFVLIICCLYTILGLFKMAEGIVEAEGPKAIAGFIILILGVLAIIFQSISL